MISERRIGIAGWAIPAQYRDRTPAEGSHLERYAQCFNAVEINSSFYRPHRRGTYERWAASVPDDFRFSAKVPKLITHERRLHGCEQELARFAEESAGLGSKLAALLLQLPPSLFFDEVAAGAFFASITAMSAAPVVCEPRHPTWFTAAAQNCLSRYRVGRVAADPACVPEAAEPCGYSGLAYYRLHGTPKMYYSSYDPSYLNRLRLQLDQQAKLGDRTWCIFDNTAENAAWANASELQRSYSHQQP